MKCLQCDSDRIAKNVRAIDRGDNLIKRELSLQTQTNPQAAIFKGRQEHHMRANVCADCGYVMLSVALKDAEAIFKRENTA